MLDIKYIRKKYLYIIRRRIRINIYKSLYSNFGGFIKILLIFIFYIHKNIMHIFLSTSQTPHKFANPLGCFL